MALSYLSTPSQDKTGYIQPFSLDVMAKVLSSEQGAFTAEGKKIQNQIDDFGNLDVIKGEDKQYLNQKINNLVGGINDLGGVNLADENIGNKIEGMGSSIYGDRNILNAVASTRQIRSLQNSYEKMKTDPKLSKQYSKTNEDWDNQFVNAYSSDGKIGSSYSGPSSSTPYAPYRDNLLKALDKVKANISTNITNDGLTFTTTDGKIISPERISAAAADLLLPDEKTQMEKDGWGAFKDANPLLVVQQSLDLNNQKLGDSKMTYNRYMTQAIAAGNDIETQQKYKALADNEKQNINQLTAASQKIQSEGLQQYNKDPHGYMAQVYKDQFYRGIGERFASSQVQSKLSNNPAAIMQLKLQKDEDEFNQKMLFNVVTNGGKEGTDFVVDPKSGRVILSGTNFNKETKGKAAKDTGANLAPLAIPDVNDPDLYKKTEQSFSDQNKSLDEQKASLFNDYWDNYLNKNYNISELLQSTQSGSGISHKLPGQEILEGVNKQPGLQIEDLNFSDATGQKVEQAIHKSNPQMDLQSIHTKVQAIKKMYDDYDKMTHTYFDPSVDISHIDPQLKNVVETYQLLDEQKKANLAKVKAINDTVTSKANLSAKEKALYDDYINHPDKYPVRHVYPIGSGGGYSLGTTASLVDEIDPRITPILAKINGPEAIATKNQLYQDVSNRPVYRHVVFSGVDDPLLSTGKIQNQISAYIRANGSIDKQLPAGRVIPANKIFPTDAGRNASNTGYGVTANVEVGVDSDKQPIYKSVSIDLDANQASDLGFNTDPYDALNQSAALQGGTSPLLMSASGANGKTLAAKFRFARINSKDRNDQSVIPQLIMTDRNGSYPINISNKVFPTASAGYVTMKDFLQKAANQGWTLQDIADRFLHPEKYSNKP